MKKIFTAATVEEAKQAAAAEFGAAESEITFAVIEEPKKGLFGKVKGEAKVEAEYEPPVVVTKADVAKKYMLDVIAAMGIENAEITVSDTENGALFEIKSQEIEELIGKKGELLDAFQSADFGRLIWISRFATRYVIPPAPFFRII